MLNMLNMLIQCWFNVDSAWKNQPDKRWDPRFHQTWRAGKWTIGISDFPAKTSIPEGFSITMFDCERVMMEKPAWYRFKMMEKPGSYGWCWMIQPLMRMTGTVCSCLLSCESPDLQFWPLALCSIKWNDMISDNNIHILCIYMYIYVYNYIYSMHI